MKSVLMQLHLLTATNTLSWLKDYQYLAVSFHFRLAVAVVWSKPPYEAFDKIPERRNSHCLDICCVISWAVPMFQNLQFMTVRSAPALQFRSSDVFGSQPKSCNFLSMPTTNFRATSILAKSKNNTQKESAKILNRRRLKKFNGTATKPRLSVFCSTKQLYAMVVDDQNKKCLFYGSTLQKSFRGDTTCSTVEAAECIGEELVKACADLNINEVSYDRNGFARGERMQAFEIAISRHGFLPDRLFRKSS